MKTLKGPLFLVLLFASTTAPADTIEYSVENVAGDRWQYNYTFVNTGTSAFDNVLVYFDLGLYADLAITASPADWDSLVFQPDAGLPADGLFDSLSLGVPLAPGGTVGVFSVAFDFLGVGTPGEQYFEMWDFLNFAVVADGFTTLVEEPVPVPAPPTFGLLALGLAGALAARRWRRTTDA